MTGNSIDCPDNPWRFGDETVHPAKPHEGLFSDLTQIETLHTAYAQLREALAVESPVNGSEAPSAGDEANSFLQQLSKDLRAGTFRVKNKISRRDADNLSDNDARTDLRNRIVQRAVAHALESVFPTDPPANPVAWTAAAIGKGLSRVYTVTIDESEADHGEHILAVVRERVPDLAFFALLADLLKSIDLRDAAGSNTLASVLNRIAIHNIDQVLQQANLLGRQGSHIHATCIRFDREVALFLDNDTQYDWLLPAVQKRLREALVEIKAEVDPEKTQVVDLARGEKLHFLDHEFRLREDRDGPARVQYKRVVKACAPEPQAKKLSRRNWFPKVPHRVYAIAAGVMIGAAVLAVFAAAALILRSHGPQLYPVRGQVFYEGKPVVGALVAFLPKDPSSPQGHIASALVAEDGSYVLGTHKANDGALAGPYVVTIWRPRGTIANALPSRYGSRHTTPLTAIVEMGPTEVPMFQLEPEFP